MTAYRFCRTDDIPLLVAAWERCRGPEDADAPALEREGFKKLIRGIDLWCSSCMVALEGADPIGVVLGAKRAEATLVYGIRVHPRYRRLGHARHLLTSLGQKLAILGPPRLVAEVPVHREAARALLEACRWQKEERLVDWTSVPGPYGENLLPPTMVQMAQMTPITLEEASSAGLLGRARCWHRDLNALRRIHESLLGLALHSPEGIESCLFFRPESSSTKRHPGWEILAAGCGPTATGRQALQTLFAQLRQQAEALVIRFPRIAEGEIDDTLLTDLFLEPGAEYDLFATVAEAA